MKLTRNDTYIERTKGKAREIKGTGNKPLPWWFFIDGLRPKLKFLFWQWMVMFGVSGEQAKAGYRIGFIVNGRAYIGDEVLHENDAIFRIRRENSWTVFAVGLDGEVIPDQGADRDAIGKRFWVDTNPENDLSEHLDGRREVD